MDFWDLTKLLFRRWYLAVPLLLLTASVSAYTYFTVTPDYKATAFVQLIPPTASAAPTGTATAPPIVNPWLNLGIETLNTAAGVTTQDNTFLAALVKDGYSDSIVVDVSDSSIARIEVVGNSKLQASETATRVADRYSETVARLQNDRSVSKSSLITTIRLDQGDNLAETGGKVKRALIAVAIAGLLMTVALTVGFDALMRRRRRPTSSNEPEPVPALVARSSTGPRQEIRGSLVPVRPFSSVTHDRAIERVSVVDPGPTAVVEFPAGGSDAAQGTGTAAVQSGAEEGVPEQTDVTIVLPLSFPGGRRGDSDRGNGGQRR